MRDLEEIGHVSIGNLEVRKSNPLGNAQQLWMDEVRK
jgi:hypothetical protein